MVKTDLLGNQISEVEIIYKPKVKSSERPIITSSQSAYDIIKNLYNQDLIEYKESFFALFLNRGNKVLAFKQISEGGQTGTVVDSREILITRELIKEKLKLASVAVIITHNHPSGNLKPSKQDIELTKRLKSSLELMNSTLLDHIIVTDEGYLSFADEGIL